MPTKHVPSEANSRANTGRIVVLIGRVVSGTGQSGHVQLVGTFAVHERVLSGVRKELIEVSDVAKVVVERTHDLGAQTDVQSQIRTSLPVVLHEKTVVVGSVLVVENTPTSKASGRRSFKEVLDVADSVRGGAEEQLPIEDLRELLVEVDAGVLAPESDAMGALNPADVIDKTVVVLDLELIGRGGGPHLKAGQRELVDGLGNVAHRPINPEIVSGNRWLGSETIVASDKTETEIRQDGRRE